MLDFGEHKLMERIAKGDTLGGILKNQKINNDDIQKITKIAQKENLTALKIGKTITFEYDISLTENDGEDLATEQKTLNMISFESILYFWQNFLQSHRTCL